jgi:DNA-binding MarR family transcriptional regulator
VPGSDDALSLDEHLCFAVYSTANAFKRAYTPLLHELGLTYPQYLVMVVLWEGTEQTVGSIGDRLLLRSSTLTPLLKRLETSGLIVRGRSQLDERVVDISLTALGLALHATAKTVQTAVSNGTGLNDRERDRLRGAIFKVRDSLSTSMP